MTTQALCTRCGSMPATPGYKTCTRCRERHRAQRQAWRREHLDQDLCKSCNQPRVPGTRYCLKHLAAIRAGLGRLHEEVHAKRKERREHGLCQTCGKPVEPPSTRFCAEHREEHLGREAMTRDRKAYG